MEVIIVLAIAGKPDSQNEVFSLECLRRLAEANSANCWVIGHTLVAREFTPQDSIKDGKQDSMANMGGRSGFVRPS
jgi:hypothetical protein